MLILPCLLLGLLLSGCSNIGQKSTPAKFYVLSALPQSTEPLPEFKDNPPSVGVPQVVLPSYLDRPQITYRLNGNEVQFSEFARWAEPLGDGITRVLRQNLTELMGAGKVAAFPWMQPYPRSLTFSVVVSDFAANVDGKAELSVIYRIADSKNQETYLIKEATFTQSADGGLTNDSAVEALSDTLAQFARQGAADLAEVAGRLEEESPVPRRRQVGSSTVTP